MHTYQLSLTACVWRLENGTVVAEAPSFPELSCAGDSARLVLPRLERGIRKLARRLPRVELIRRQSVSPVTAESLRISFEPVIRTPGWLNPVETQFTVVLWPHGEDGWVLWVPVLGIHVLGRSEREVRDLATAQIRAAVARETAKWATNLDGISLARLSELQRTVRVRLVSLTVQVPIQTPKLSAQIEEQEQQPKKSVLKDATDSLTVDPIVPSFGNEATVALMASILTGRRPRSLLLVGPSGVGKTAALRELVRRRDDFGLGQTDFRSTSGARLMAGMSSFGMWQERCQALCRETDKSGTIVHLGSLVELMEVGRCEGNSMGIATFLRPYLIRGALLAVAECTHEQLALAERLYPQVVQAFEIVRVAEPDATTSRQILTHFAQQFPQPLVRTANGDEAPVTLIDASGLAAIERLHRRYATYSAVPGRPLRFLKNLLRDRFDSIQLRASFSAPAEAQTAALSETDIIAAFARETGLPTFLLDDHMAFDPLQARQSFARRIVGQDAAVSSVLTLLSTIKAGLSRPGRPLASLLFIGPTGVGKTELARTLAEYLFGDEDRLTRLDMSEYSDPISAARLIGGSMGEEGVLTAKIREQPFSVLLLDEFEKADGHVFDLMLQVLGEGRLTDDSGRMADFTNAVIVMTSNLGAEGYQQGTAGFARTRADITDHFLETVRRFFRPELFNRFDSVIPFQPLGLDVLRSIAELQVARMRTRDGLVFRGRGWEIDPVVLDNLAHTGFDPRYGARPLKRTIERELLAPLAEQINSLPPDRAITIKVNGVGSGLAVKVTPWTDLAGRQVDWTQVDPGQAADILRVTTIRRRTRRLLDGPPVQSLRNELYRLETQLEKERRRMLKRTAVGKPWKPEPDYNARSARAAVLRTLQDEMQGLRVTIDALEDQALLGVLLNQANTEFHRDEANRLDREWGRLASEVYLHQFPNPDKVTVAVFSEHQSALKDLVLAYRDVAVALGADRTDLWEYSSAQQGVESHRVEFENDDADPLWRRRVAKASIFLNQIPDSVVGLAWYFSGRGLYARLRSEAGIHVFVKGNLESVCLVATEATEGNSYCPPAGIGRQGTIAKLGKKTRCRTYDLNENRLLATDLHQSLLELIRQRYELEVAEAVIGRGDGTTGENGADSQ